MEYSTPAMVLSLLQSVDVDAVMKSVVFTLPTCLIRRYAIAFIEQEKNNGKTIYVIKFKR